MIPKATIATSHTSEPQDQHVVLTLVRGYEFIAEFPDSPGSSVLLLDEPQPLSGNRAPNAAALLGAAVGDCLAASLTLGLRKSRATVEGMTANVVTHVTRDEAGKVRISGIDVELVPEVAGGVSASLDGCESLFEDFCIVTESVRRGVPVSVSVKAREAQVSNVHDPPRNTAGL